MAFALALIFIVQGLYGGMVAISRWVRGYTGFFILRPAGAAAYAMLLLASAPIFLFITRQMDGPAQLFLFALMPFAVFGHVLFLVAILLETGARWLGPSEMPVARTFDQADALVARKQYAEAEAAYRAELRADPACLEALLRLCRLLEQIGRPEESVRELSAAHEAALHDAPRQDAKTRRERLLCLTFALGDVLVERLEDSARACAVYERTLQVLFGCPEADPLRDRIKALDAVNYRSISEAAEAAQPSRLTL